MLTHWGQMVLCSRNMDMYILCAKERIKTENGLNPIG